MEKTGRLLRMRDVVRITGFHEDTIRNYLRRGTGPVAIKTPTNKLLFPEADLRDWLESMRLPQRTAE
jgi:predicted DNA-binding transcriptional regulator AlpA